MEEDTRAETPKAKTHLSLTQTVRLIDVIENLARRISTLSKQMTFLLIKNEKRDPAVYNEYTRDEDKQTNLLIESFKDSLEEESDRPSQSIVVNVNPKKSDTPPKKLAGKITYWTLIIAMAISGIVTGLKEVGIIR